MTRISLATKWLLVVVISLIAMASANAQSENVVSKWNLLLQEKVRTRGQQPFQDVMKPRCHN
jgi:hypothetical protein